MVHINNMAEMNQEELRLALEHLYELKCGMTSNDVKMYGLRPFCKRVQRKRDGKLCSLYTLEAKWMRYVQKMKNSMNKDEEHIEDIETVSSVDEGEYNDVSPKPKILNQSGCYLLQPFADFGTEKYKIGRSKNVQQRLCSPEYRNANIIEVIYLNDVETCERQIIDEFSTRFEVIKKDDKGNFGNEYFQGDINSMKKVFHKVCSAFLEYETLYIGNVESIKKTLIGNDPVKTICECIKLRKVLHILCTDGLKINELEEFQIPEVFDAYLIPSGASTYTYFIDSKFALLVSRTIRNVLDEFLFRIIDFVQWLIEQKDIHLSDLSKNIEICYKLKSEYELSKDTKLEVNENILKIVISIIEQHIDISSFQSTLDAFKDIIH